MTKFVERNNLMHVLRCAYNLRCAEHDLSGRCARDMHAGGDKPIEPAGTIR